MVSEKTMCRPGLCFYFQLKKFKKVPFQGMIAWCCFKNSVAIALDIINKSSGIEHGFRVFLPSAGKPA